MFRNAVRRMAAPAALRAVATPAKAVVVPRAASACRPALASRSLSAVTTTSSEVAPASYIGRAGEIDDLTNQDGYFEKDRVAKGDPGKREFTYFMLGASRFLYASSARLILLKFLASWEPAADVMALATAEFELKDIEMGTSVIFKWRGKPVFIKRRDDAMIEREAAVLMEDLRDQETDEERCLKPEFMIVIGICTHLGCVPLPDAGDYNGSFCPCHGSHYDTAGRIRKGPAPLNLEIPPYKFLTKTSILVG
ncbi:unnamed protein product [Ectocarpus sp. 6 AP-2014]